MVRGLTLGAGLSAAVVLTLVCLRINPGAVDWRRWSIPALSSQAPPWPVAVGIATDVARTWAPPERFAWYRGAETRDGVAADAVVEPPLALEWQTPSFNVGIHGASKSSPAVDDSGVYVGADAGAILAFTPEGRPKWRFRVDDAKRGVHSTPILSKHRVYVGSYGGTFYVLDKTDGTLIWTFHNDMTAFGSSPLVIDDTLVAAIETETLNAFVTALDPRDGAVKWRSPFLGEQIHSSPAFDRASGTIVIGANNKTIFGLDVNDGHVRWRTIVGGEVKGTPLIKDGVAYVTSWAGRVHALDARAGRILWDADLGGPSQSSPTLIPGGDVMVMGNSRGQILGIDRRDGRRRWVIERTDAVLSSALAAPDARGRYLAWIGCGSNHLCGIDAARGRVVDEVALPGQLTGVPVAFGAHLYASLNFPGGLVRFGSAPDGHRAPAALRPGR